MRDATGSVATERHGAGVVRIRSLAAGTVVFALLGLLGPPLGAAPSQPNVHATLIRVHAFEAAKGGKGGPPAPATANCSPDDPTADGGTAYTGWKSTGGDAFLNVSTVPSSVPNPAGVLQSAFAVWGNAPDFTVWTSGAVTRQTANRRTDLLFGRVSGGSIAVTYTWRWSDGVIESDTVFNRSLAWAVVADAANDGCDENAPVYDLQNIAVHEFGHIYGLDHPAGSRFESMYRYGYTGETLKRTPEEGDLAGIAALYP